MGFHDFTVKALDGRDHPLSAYKGKVVLVVNTASECGYTPQYAGLQKLHDELSGRGFTVLGVPSNDFGAQEPGGPEQIRNFCDTRFKVRFPLTEKMVVKGKNKAPLYGFLSEDEGEPKWNFHKYLVGRDGEVIAGYPSSETPEGKRLRADIDKALAG